jgi:hypothetical protein
MIWSAKRPGNVVMVSKAREPQIKAGMGAPEGVEVESSKWRARRRQG